MKPSHLSIIPRASISGAQLLRGLAMTILFTGATSQAALVHHWAFDSNLNDSSGNNNTGTLNSGSADYSTVAGKIGQAIYLSGGQSVFNTNPANIPVTGTGAWSLTVWAQYGDISLGHGAVVAGWRPTAEATGQMRMLINGNGSQLTFWGSNADNFGGSWPAVNAWHQLTITHEANADKQVTVYINGVGTTVSIGGSDLANITSTPTVQVGGNTGWSPAQTFTGAIDDMGIWDQALSAGQVGTLSSILTVNGAALDDYGISNMSQLFNAYDTNGSATIDSMNWSKFTGASGTAGTVTFSGDTYTAWFDGTSGMIGTVIPEPASGLLLMSVAGLGLLRRKRQP